MNSEFEEIVRKLIAERGKEALLDADKCRGLLDDYKPSEYERSEYQKERDRLLQVLDDAGVKKAVSESRNVDDTMKILRGTTEKTHFERGNEYYIKGDFDNAVKEYTQAIKLESEKTVCCCNCDNKYKFEIKFEIKEKKKTDRKLVSIYVTSPDDRYRYVLGEIYDEKILYCVGVNPSTATPQKDDQTISNVREIAHHKGFDSWVMLNLYPQKSSDLKANKIAYDEAVHKKNLAEIKKIIPNGSTIWLAWGDLIFSENFFLDCFTEIFNEIGKKEKIKYVRLNVVKKDGSVLPGLTNEGNPRHPARVPTPSKQKLVDFDISECKVAKRLRRLRDGKKTGV
ncbi:MAG: hypothetical protein Pg6C_04610 [Treponemataceae bacterium]|nr:MAG: hypothetical protein Pg6C_04610 [Treponemataceae bacterium]